MRVAVLVPGGVDRSGTHRVIPVLLWLVERLARTHDVHVFAMYQERFASTYDLCGATVHTVPRRWARWHTLRAMVREHRRHPFDLIHAFWAIPSGALGAVVAWRIRRPMLLHLAGGELASLRDIRYGGRLTWRGRAQARLALAGAHTITVAVPSMALAALAVGATTESLVLGVDLAQWPVTPPRPRTGGNPARLIHVASLNRVKDQATLLRAIARLRGDGVSLHLDLVGEDIMRGELRQFANSLGVEDCVTFHGFLRQADLRPLMLRSDLHVMSSRHEGGEVVTLEAAVCGVPTVGTEVGHVGRLAPEAAVAVPVGDHDALADAMARLLDDDDLRLSVAHAAQRSAAADDADATATRVMDMYREMTAEPTSR